VRSLYLLDWTWWVEFYVLENYGTSNSISGNCLVAANKVAVPSPRLSAPTTQSLINFQTIEVLILLSTSPDFLWSGH
jgi:hypothetical protein